MIANRKQKQPRAPKPSQARVRRRPRQQNKAPRKPIRQRRNRGSRAPNAFEPKISEKRDIRSGTYAKPNVDFTQLSPNLQFELACAHPGRYRSPFVENGRVLDIPTQILAGQFNQPGSPATNNSEYYSLIMLDATATTVYGGGTGLHSAYNTASTYVPYTLSSDYLGGGIAYSTVFGTYTYSDKLLPFAIEASIEVLAPAAIVSGIVHIGCVSLASLPGMSFANLRSRASMRIDLKSMVGKAITLRACIGNTALIHYLSGNSNPSYYDEWVSYALFENATMPLTPGDGTTTPILGKYTLSIGLNAQAVWWPDGAQPAMAGLAEQAPSATDRENSKRKTIDDENADALAKTHHHPTIFENLSEIVSNCIKGVSIGNLLNVMERVASIAPMAMSVATMFMAEEDEQPSLSSVIEDDAAILQWETTREDKSFHFKEWPEEISATYDEYLDVRDQLINQMSKEIRVRKRVRDTLCDARQRLHSKHGHSIVEYSVDGKLVTPAQLYTTYLAEETATYQTELDSFNQVQPDLLSQSGDLGKRSLTGRLEFEYPDNLPTPKLLKKK